MYWVSSSNLSSFILNARVFIFVQLPSLTAFAEIEDIGVSVAYAIYLQYFGVQQVLILLSVIDIRQSVGRHYRTKGIPIYTTEAIKNGMNRNYCMVDKIYSAHRPIVKEIPFKIKDFTITAFEVPHDGSDNVGFFISYGNLYFAFATDLGHITPTADKYLRQANYLVIESNYDEAMLRNGSYPLHLQRRILADSGHMDNARTAEYLARIYTPALRNIFLCHLSGDNNHPELAYKTVENRLYEEGIRVGKDVELVALTRNHPSELYTFEESEKMDWESAVSGEDDCLG